jgi:hypothetical protein
MCFKKYVTNTVPIKICYRTHSIANLKVHYRTESSKNSITANRTGEVNNTWYITTSTRKYEYCSCILNAKTVHSICPKHYIRNAIAINVDAATDTHANIVTLRSTQDTKSRTISSCR